MNKHAFMAVIVLTADFLYAGGRTNTWTGAAHDGDWSNPLNFADASFAPGVDDVVAVEGGCDAYINATSASWARMNALRQVFPKDAQARLVITVPDGCFMTNDCPFSKRDVSHADSGSLQGVLVKRGGGTLELGAVDKCRYGTTCYAFTSISVEEGVLMMPQHCGNVNFSFLDLTVAEGATLFTSAQNGSAAVSGDYAYTTVYGTVSGSGTIANQGQNSPLRLADWSKMDFAGKMTGGIRLLVAANSKVVLSGANSDFFSSSGIGMEGNAVLELAKFGRSNLTDGDPSSMGTNTKFDVRSGDRIVYIGNGENVFKSMIVRESPFFFDAGAIGGLDVDGSEWSGYYGSSTTPSKMQHLVLDGSNATASVFHPYIRYWSDQIGERTNCTFYISKRGTGIWHLKENVYSEWRGGTGVDNGTLQFSSLDEAGNRCSFGMGTDLYDAYCGVKDDSHKVDYSIRLGDGKTTGTLEYIGDSFVNVSTRPFGIQGSGRLVNSSNRRILIRNVFGIGEGENELILDGTNVTQDTIENVANGSGKLSIVKRGAGSWILGGEQTFEGDLRVEGGELTVKDSRRYDWFKWTVRQVYAHEEGGSGDDYEVIAAQFALYDAEGNMISKNMAVHGATADRIHGDSDYLTLKPHSAQLARWDYKYDNPTLTSRIVLDNSNNDYTWPKADHMHLERLFDDTPATYAWGDGTEVFAVYSRGSVMVSKPKYWVSVVMRTRPGETVTSYDWASHKDSIGFVPTCWTLQGSVNGFDWVDLDVQDNVKFPTGWNNAWSYHAPGAANMDFKSGQKRQGYPLQATGPENPPAVLTKVRSIYVAPGARLVADGNLTISSLKTDVAGMGEIEGFSFAENGELDVTNITRGKVDEIPFGFPDAAGIENVANWTLKSNGRIVTNRTLSIRDGKFVLTPDGMSVIIR